MKKRSTQTITIEKPGLSQTLCTINTIAYLDNRRSLFRWTRIYSWGSGSRVIGVGWQIQTSFRHHTDSSPVTTTHKSLGGSEASRLKPKLYPLFTTLRLFTWTTSLFLYSVLQSSFFFDILGASSSWNYYCDVTPDRHDVRHGVASHQKNSISRDGQKCAEIAIQGTSDQVWKLLW